MTEARWPKFDTEREAVEASQRWSTAESGDGECRYASGSDW